MKSHIRKILDREKPKPKRGGFHRSITIQAKLSPKPAHYMGSVADTQTPEERQAREEAAKAATLRFQQKLAAARPTGEKCSRKACPFPAVLDGECRQHAAERVEPYSTFGSTLAYAQSIAHILYC